MLVCLIFYILNVAKKLIFLLRYIFFKKNFLYDTLLFTYRTLQKKTFWPAVLYFNIFTRFQTIFPKKLRKLDNKWRFAGFIFFEFWIILPTIREKKTTNTTSVLYPNQFIELCSKLFFDWNDLSLLSVY